MLTLLSNSWTACDSLYKMLVRQDRALALFLSFYTLNQIPPPMSLCFSASTFSSSISHHSSPRLPIISAVNQFVLNNHCCPGHSTLFLSLFCSLGSRHSGAILTNEGYLKCGPNPFKKLMA